LYVNVPAGEKTVDLMTGLGLDTLIRSVALQEDATSMDDMHKTRERAPIFDKIYRDYVNQLSGKNLAALAEHAGGIFENNALRLKFLNQTYYVSKDDVLNEQGNIPDHSTAVVLLRYLIYFPQGIPVPGEWVPYRSFRDAAPFVGGFRNNSELPLVRAFSGRRDALVQAARVLGGKDPGLDWDYQVKCEFPTLPRVPLLLLFNDEDEEFPGEARILFRDDAEKFLDMECLAILGWLLSSWLIKADQGQGS